MKNEVILQLQEAGFWTLKEWADAHGFDPKVVSVVISRYHKIPNDAIPRGKTAQILQKLNETLAKAPAKQAKLLKTFQSPIINTDWLNFKEAVEYLRINKEKTLRNWVAKGVIPHVKEPSTGTLRFHKKALDSWLLRGER
jgi:excisionase family DNA binding protein